MLLKNGNLLSPVYAYRDSRTQAVIPEVHSILLFAQLYQRTGIQFQPFNSIYQLYADKKAGRLAEAEELTLQALQAWEKIYGHVSLQAAACLDALGKLRNVCGEKREGTDFHRRAADIKMQVLGEHETTAASLGHIGMAEAELGNWKEAETLLASSLEQFDRLGVGKNAEGIAAFREKLNECRNMLAKEPTDE